MGFSTQTVSRLTLSTLPSINSLRLDKLEPWPRRATHWASSVNTWLSGRPDAQRPVARHRWRRRSPCFSPPTTTLTCLEDLIAQGKACPLPGVVRGELDVEDRAGGHDGGRGDVPTVLSQQICGFAVSISNLNEVIPGCRQHKGHVWKKITARRWNGPLCPSSSGALHPLLDIQV